MEKKIHAVVKSTDSTMHGGLCVKTTYFDNGDGEIFTNQEIILSANCNEAVIRLYDNAQLTSKFLRDLANALDKGEIEAKMMVSAQKSDKTGMIV